MRTQQPTHSDPLLGNNNSGYGPSFVMLHWEKGDPWVYGFLVNNAWSSNNSSSPATTTWRARISGRTGRSVCMCS